MEFLGNYQMVFLRDGEDYGEKEDIIAIIFLNKKHNIEDFKKAINQLISSDYDNIEDYGLIDYISKKLAKKFDFVILQNGYTIVRENNIYI